MCQKIRTRDADINEVNITGKIVSDPVLYRFNGKPRCKIMVEVMAEWGQPHVFIVQTRGDEAIVTAINSVRGRMVQIFNARLRNSRGRITLVPRDGINFAAMALTADHLRRKADMLDWFNQKPAPGPAEPAQTASTSPVPDTVDSLPDASLEDDDVMDDMDN